MNTKPTIAEIKASVNIVDVIGGYVSLQKKGAEMVGLCPFHDDHSSSLQVNENKQIFKCFACGEGGDVVDFLNAQGKTIPEALQELSGGAIAQGHINKNASKPKKQAPKWEWQKPTEKPESFRHYDYGEPSAKWLYRDRTGHPVGYAVRFDLEDGKKEVLPFIYASNGAVTKWIYRGIPKPRPMYNAHLLEKNPNATALVVEGEKCADHANKNLNLSKCVAVAWMGGAGGVAHTDLTQLDGRNVILWGDNDAQGLSAMLHIAHLIKPKSAKIIPMRQDVEKGWDCADVEWGGDGMREFVKKHMEELPELGITYTVNQPKRESVYRFGMEDGKWRFKDITPEPEPPKPAEEPPKPVDPPSQPEPEPPKPQAPSVQQGEDPFTFCGYAKNESGTQSFYFYVYRSGQVVRLSSSSMTRTNLLTLAPIFFWESYFPANKGKWDNDMAQDWLIAKSIEAGIYDPESSRGRGAWIDEGRTVIHVGNRLIVDGKPAGFSDISSEFTYERAKTLKFKTDKPASNTEAHRFLELCTLLNWEDSINAYLLAGWCVIAPVCGALRWRPHVWITGPAGTGKSWIFERVVRKMLGSVVVPVQSETTEAGIRQYLGRDALPVLFDEAEGEDRKAQERIQSVLTLMRGASTSDGGMIIKGSAGGSAVRYSIRSCFAYASIGVQLTQASDKSRVSVLSLQKKEGEESRSQWENLQRIYHEVMREGFPESVQARSISMLPTILQNAETFSSAASVVFGTQREGDQIGTLLAGAFSLTSSKLISFDEALQWIESKEWGESDREEQKDERRLINLIMEHRVTVEIENTRQRFDRTVGELVMISAQPGLYQVVGSELTQEAVNPFLNRIGIKTMRSDNGNEFVIISNTSNYIKKILKETPWAKNHSGILKRLKGAESFASTTFGAHTKSRAVSIPLESIFD